MESKTFVSIETAAVTMKPVLMAMQPLLSAMTVSKHVGIKTYDILCYNKEKKHII